MKSIMLRILQYYQWTQVEPLTEFSGTIYFRCFQYSELVGFFLNGSSYYIPTQLLKSWQITTFQSLLIYRDQPARAAPISNVIHISNWTPCHGGKSTPGSIRYQYCRDGTSDLPFCRRYLVFLTNLMASIHNLLILIEKFGSFSGYKVEQQL